MSEPSPHDTLDAAEATPGEPDWDALLRATQCDALDATLIIDERQTIKARTANRSGVFEALLLPRQSMSRSQEADFQIIEALGEGGMGVVHLATQSSLMRQVAVKRLHDRDRDNLGRRQKLLQEACVTGRLEHPNIVPVYSLSIDERDHPLFVMKRIEGVSWYDTLRDEHLLPRIHRSHATLLESHLEILEQVCLAMHYAHSKGIVHRDLKPDNVMLGEYGEVYVVDWGLAVTCDEQEAGPIPHVSQIAHAEGTPMYMAPEQAAAEADRIGAHTDVYALGAILHELVTGESRHRGATVQAMLLDAYQAKPHTYTQHPMLGVICNKACARRPEDRYESAEALREHLNSYRTQRRAHEILEATDQRITRLEALGKSGELATSVVEAYSLSGASRFGLEQAAELVPNAPQLADLRRRMLVAMLRIELAHKNLAAAEVFRQELGEGLDAQDDQEFQRLEQALEEERARLATLEHLEKDLSFGVSRRQKGLLGLVLCVAWGLGSFMLVHVIDMQDARQGLADTLLYKGIVALLLIGVWVWARRAIVLTSVNIKWLDTLGLVLVLGPFISAAGLILDLEFGRSLVVEMISYSIVGWIIGITLDRAVYVVGIVYLLGVCATVALWPQTGLFIYILATCNLLAMGFMSWRWYTGKGSFVAPRMTTRGE